MSDKYKLLIKKLRERFNLSKDMISDTALLKKVKGTLCNKIIELEVELAMEDYWTTFNNCIQQCGRSKRDRRNKS